MSPQSSSPESKAEMDSTSQYLNEMGAFELLTAEEEVMLAKAIETGKHAAHQLENDVEQLSRAERTRLNATAEQGRLAREEFIRSNLRLVVSIAKQYHIEGLDTLDLIQEGNFGLMRAVDKFDWRKGFKFSTYATWWIRQSISRAIDDKPRNIRLPAHMHTSIRAVDKAYRTLHSLNGRKPSDEDVAREAGVSVQKVRDVYQYAPDTISMFSEVGEDGATLLDFVPDDIDIEDEVIKKTFIEQTIKSYETRLTSKEREILEGRFGFGDGEKKTLDEIGEKYNVTRERIRQIEQNALAKLARDPKIGQLEDTA